MKFKIFINEIALRDENFLIFKFSTKSLFLQTPFIILLIELEISYVKLFYLK